MTNRAELDIGLELDMLSSGVLDLRKYPPDAPRQQALMGTATTIARYYCYCYCYYY